MVKKKKNRHQQEPATQNGGDSTESCDENQSNNSGGRCCQHVNKSVDLTRVKKALRSGGIATECAECAKSPATSNGVAVAEEDVGLWLCLKCGHQACGRSRRQHALKHQQTPRSEPHSLAVNTELWNIWCYICGSEVSAQCRKKLHECVEFIKRQEEAPAVPKNRTENVSEKSPAEAFQKGSSSLKPNSVTSPTNNLPRVRGLCNVGNTCFFNAVLQCLARTPFLLPVLQEMSEPGTKFSLPGDPENEDLPVLEGELGKWGNLTEILASTLIELQSSKCDVYNPSRLLNKLIQRCPQFGGGEQHDSHELLRHLLEGVRTEDLKRYQSSILQLHGLSGKSNPTQVEEEVRAKAKAYGRQAAEMMLHPEQVFRGFLVSTLECQSCRHTSQRVESFLDLSLPVMADKPQPPVMRRKSNNEESYDLCGNVSEGQPSKHQMKKERKQARKERKKQKGWRAEGEQPTIAEESAIVKNSAESEQSDADVEDNVEQDAGSKDVGESGYSSEKLGNEDSAVESPISQLANGDSALASPASPADMGEVDRQSLSPVCNGDLMIESPSRDTPSPVSSEVNIDYSVLAQGDCASPDCARPVSRFEFCNDDDMDSGEGAARYSPVEEAKSLPVSDLCEDMSRLTVDYYTNTCTSFVLVSQPNTNGCEEPLVCGGDTERVDQMEEVERVGEAEKLDQVEKTGQVERVEEADEVEQVVEESDVVTDSSCKGDVVTNWSATVSPRYQCDDGECSLQSCLNQFTALELMTGNNKVGCENCTQRQNQGKEGKMVCTNSTKQLLVKTPPAVLILHLKRFQVDRAMFRKMSRHVSFPLVLDLAPICSAMYKDSLMMKPGQNQVQYALYGVVEHSGTLHGGHYVAYVKVRSPLKNNDPRWLFLPPDPQSPKRGMEKDEGGIAVGGSAEPPPGKWYFVSDSRVVEVGEERVLRSQAYLLFYERIW
ncbi:ubiquitin carboxyl-terminal hydrolase 16/45 isoform X2 [Periplaneta americana]|uniref:ubiquitin carboxyl-terminal hydrolase 16/45 isoform X2 n=1 Tax=Periplaneta americana TaxID=6978 RepID=UPI0037E8ABD8